MSGRYKSYTGETGTSYRYSLEGRRSVVRPEGQGTGSDFSFVVIADQHAPYMLRIFVSDRALAAWNESKGRPLDLNEQYALAKMCLYRAFDEIENLDRNWLSLVVDETNVFDLLAPLDL